MKKIFLIVVFLIIGLISLAQPYTDKMSNYEKYILDKEKGIIQDTIIKYDTIYIEQEKPEYDDLYFTAKKSELKLKQKELRLEKRELKKFQDSLYYDAKREVYDDLYYTSLIYRFHNPFYFSYHSLYWRFSYGWYDPFFYDPWYSWRYSYYYNWYWQRPYYPYYYNDYRIYNNYYSNIGSQKYNLTDVRNITYGRRERSSNYVSNIKLHSVPVTINKTVQIDRRSGQILGIESGNQNRIITNNTIRRNITTQPEKNLTIKSDVKTITQPQTRRTTEVRSGVVSSQNKSTYNQSQEKRTYTPNYSQPRINAKPAYNNTNPNSTRLNNQQRYNYTIPQIQNRTSSPSRSSTYSAPSRNYNLDNRSSVMTNKGGFNGVNSNGNSSRSQNSGKERR